MHSNNFLEEWKRIQASFQNDFDTKKFCKTSMTAEWTIFSHSKIDNFVRNGHSNELKQGNWSWRNFQFEFLVVRVVLVVRILSILTILWFLNWINLLLWVLISTNWKTYVSYIQVFRQSLKRSSTTSYPVFHNWRNFSSDHAGLKKPV